MKVAIFSDIHGNYQALESILKIIKKENYNQIIYLGDAISLGPDSKKCLELLKASNVIYILGNHELYFLKGYEIDEDIDSSEINHLKWVSSLLDKDDRKFLKDCPFEYTLEVYNKKIKFSHFILKEKNKVYPFMKINELNDRDNWFKYSKDYDYYFVGHEHNSSSFEKLKEKSNLILVGSSGCTKKEDTFYIELEIKEDSISFSRRYVKYDYQKFIKSLNYSNYPNRKFISKIFFGVR